VGRLAVYFSLFIAIGAIGISAFVVPRLRRTDHPSGDEYPTVLDGMALSVGVVAGILLVIAILTRTLMQYSDAFEVEPGLPIARFIQESELGLSLAMSTVMGGVVALSSLLARAHRESRPWRMIQMIAILMFLFFWSGSGHVAGGTPVLGIRPDIVSVLHVFAAGLWVGMLAVMFVTVLPVALRDNARIPMFKATIHAYSTVAMVSVAVLVVSGVTSAVIVMERPADLFATAFGRTLLVKTGVVAILLGFATFKWNKVRPRLDTLADALVARSTIRAELLLAAIVLVITSVLVVTPPY
jgi:putative copper export protein